MVNVLAQDLREAVLQAAMQGKLTHHEETDSVITISPVDQQTDTPFEIPEYWAFVHLGDLFNIRSSRRVHESDWRKEGVPFYRAREVVKLSKDGVVDNELFISEELFEQFASSSGVPKPGDLLVSGVGTLGATYIVQDDDRFYYKDASVLCFENTNKQNSEFAKYMMASPYMMQQIYDSSAFGTTVATLTMKRANAFVVSLPPVEEQARIVARVGELMAKIDEYEKLERQLVELKQKFPEEMKASILQAAMQGKLTEQNRADMSAFSLVSSILEERKQLAKTKLIKAIKTYSSESLDDMEVPDNWAKTHLGDISTYQESKKKIKYTEAGKDMWSLDLEDIEKGGRLLAKVKVGDRKSSGDKTIFEEGDILYSKLRPYLLKILVAPDGGICTSELVPFKVYGGINPNFIVQYLKSPFVDNYINSVTYGVKMPRVNTETMENLAVPIPPIEEQQRIVEKLDSLLPLCDELAELV